MYVTNHAQDNIHNIQILQSYHYKGHDVSTVKAPLLADWKSTGSTVLGSVGRRGFTPKPITLQAYSFGLPEPREAKVCQPWLDNNKLIDVNDPHESIGITRISTVLNQHAIVNSLKIITCLKCHRQTPGFDIPFSELKVLQHGRKKYMENDDIVNALKKSEVLKTSVKLCPTFNTSPECTSTSI